MLDVFQMYGHDEVDTAQVNGGGSSEADLDQLIWQNRGIVMSTKLMPKTSEPFPYSHKEDDLKPLLQEDLKALQTEIVDAWYLHVPDVSRLCIALSLPRIVISHVSETRVLKPQLANHTSRLILNMESGS